MYAAREEMVQNGGFLPEKDSPANGTSATMSELTSGV
jgi:hypothetical protein